MSSGASAAHAVPTVLILMQIAVLAFVALWQISHVSAPGAELDAEFETRIVNLTPTAVSGATGKNDFLVVLSHPTMLEASFDGTAINAWDVTCGSNTTREAVDGGCAGLAFRWQRRPEAGDAETGCPTCLTEMSNGCAIFVDPGQLEDDEVVLLTARVHDMPYCHHERSLVLLVVLVPAAAGIIFFIAIKVKQVSSKPVIRSLQMNAAALRRELHIVWAVHVLMTIGVAIVAPLIMSLFHARSVVWTVFLALGLLGWLNNILVAILIAGAKTGYVSIEEEQTLVAEDGMAGQAMSSEDNDEAVVAVARDDAPPPPPLSPGVDSELDLEQVKLDT